MTKIEDDALVWANGEGFGILTELGVRSTQGDGPTDKVPDYGMECDPRDILRAAYVQVAPIIDWMTNHEMDEAVPPAYAQHIGAQILDSLAVAA